MLRDVNTQARREWIRSLQTIFIPKDKKHDEIMIDGKEMFIEQNDEGILIKTAKTINLWRKKEYETAKCLGLLKNDWSEKC